MALFFDIADKNIGHTLCFSWQEPLCPPLRIAQLQDEIVPLNIAEIAEMLPEYLHIGIGAGTPATEPTDAMHFRRRLRLGGERRHKDGKARGKMKPMTLPHMVESSSIHLRIHSG